MTAHLSRARRGARLGVSHWIRSLGPNDPIVTVLQECEPERLPELEMSWIARLRDDGVQLLNYTDGGDGFRGPHSPETREKMSRTRKGVPKSAEWVERFASAQRGQKRRPLTEAECKRISVMHKGRKRSEITRERLRRSQLDVWQRPGYRESRMVIPRATHCKRGHEFNDENTRFDKDGHRRCKCCALESQRRRRTCASL